MVRRADGGPLHPRVYWQVVNSRCENDVETVNSVLLADRLEGLTTGHQGLSMPEAPCGAGCLPRAGRSAYNPEGPCHGAGRVVLEEAFMPTYVYRGETTGVEFEVEQRITEAPLTHHPETGEPVRRVIQAAGIVFKGSGFYKTDSRSGSGASSAKNDSSSKADGGSAASASSDSGSKPSGDSSSAKPESKAAPAKAD